MTIRAYAIQEGFVNMLIIENNSVYEIDEECTKRKKVPKGCQTYEKLNRKQERNRAPIGAHAPIGVHEKKER